MDAVLPRAVFVNRRFRDSEKCSQPNVFNGSLARGMLRNELIEVPASCPGAPSANMLLEICGQLVGTGVPVCVSHAGSNSTTPLQPAAVPERPQLLLCGSAGLYGPRSLPWRTSGSCPWGQSEGCSGETSLPDPTGKYSSIHGRGKPVPHTWGKTRRLSTPFSAQQLLTKRPHGGTLCHPVVNGFQERKAAGKG